MKKSDLLIVGFLMLLLVMWGPIARKIDGTPPPGPPVETQPDSDGTNPAITSTNSPVIPVMGTATPIGVASNQAIQVVDTNAPVANVDNPAPAPAAAAKPTFAEADNIVLSNAKVNLVFSKRGACLLSAELLEYPEYNTEGSEPKMLSFTNRPSLVLEGLTGIDTVFNAQSTSNSIVFRADLADGLELIRRVELSDDFRIKVVDLVSNQTDQVFKLPDHQIVVGGLPRTDSANKYAQVIGIDTRLKAGGEVEHLNKVPIIPWKKAYVGKRMKTTGKLQINEVFRQTPMWVATKNKFFCNIVSLGVQTTFPDPAGVQVTTDADTDKQVSFVESGMHYTAFEIPAQTSLERHMSSYIGPKKFTELSKMNANQQRVMEFGMLTFLCELLLRVLNFYDGLIGSIGWSIILLTLTIKIIFFPLLRAGTKHMKGMQVLGPEMKIINEKFKDQPQKKQAAVMELYRKHGMSPLAPLKGCLPMLVQIPVFFSLYFMIRSAVELRYSHWLWVDDLSEPENLFTHLVPMGVNFLPFLMAGSSVFMQKMMQNPAMDKNQQRMMMMMPVIFLFIMYSFPAGLMLYWTSNNLFSIVQQWITLREKKKDGSAGDPNVIDVTPEETSAPKLTANPKKKKRKK